MLNFLLRKNVVWPMAGFGTGGLLWGLEAYRGTVGAGETFTNPFSYILGAVAMAIAGGLALAYATNLKQAPKLIVVGIIGWLVAFFVPAMGAYELWLAGNIIFVAPELLISGDTIDNFLSLAPSLGVGYFWLEFLISGVIVGAVYAVLLKTKIIKTALWGGIGLALASLIGPIFGNLIGSLFDSLFISYLITFLVIGKIFGFAVGRALR